MRIVIHVVDGASMFHLSVPQLVFGEVARAGAPWETVLYADAPGSVTTLEGVRLTGLPGPEVVAGADLVVEPTWHADGRPTPPETVRLLREAHASGATIVGLCLGTVPVVDAGLLDGRAAVTHWQAFGLLRDRRPGVVLDETALYADHGDVLTSAGTAAGLDACLHIVRLRLGVEMANAVARRLVVAPHREGGQAQYVESPVPSGGDGAHVSRAMEFALGHLDEPLPVTRLARAAHRSARSFARDFVAVTGTTPARWVRARRLDEARRLLEAGDQSIEQVAAACGMGAVTTLRQAFVAAYGTTPSAYRRRFAVDR